MKYIKMLGLLAVAASALMAFAATATATTITSSTGSTPTFRAVSEGYFEMHTEIANIKCNSTVDGTFTSHHGGVPTKPASGPIATLHFTNCTNGSVHTGGIITTPGELRITGSSPTGNGTLISNGASMTFTIIGILCGLTTNNTHIGELTAGEHATLHIKGASIPRTHGSAFCGASWNWTASYKFTHPTNLSIH